MRAVNLGIMVMSKHATGMVVLLFILAAYGCSDSTSHAASSDKKVDKKAEKVEVKKQTTAETLSLRQDCKDITALAEGNVSDVRGVRPGQTYDEVKRILGCLDSTARVEDGGSYLRANTFGQSVRQILLATDGRLCRDDEIPSLSRQFQYEKAGGTCRTIGQGDKRPYTEMTDQTRVIFTGVMGEEIAHAVFREKQYESGQQPALESIKTALIKKYGEPNKPVSARYGERMLWLYDTRGRSMSKSHPAFNQCDINPDFEGRQSWSSDCGVIIGARLLPPRDNPLLVKTLQVAVMDEAGLYKGQIAMEAALSAAQKAKQAEDAARAADAAKGVDL